LLGRSMVRVYARAEDALRETLSEAPAPEEVIRPVPSLLETAQLLSVTLPEHSAAAGKAIKDAGLRLHSGASIVGIERDGDRIINPPPEEVLQPEDRILLL